MTAMGLADFISGLKELGYEVEDLGRNRIAFRYEIPFGRFKAKEIKLGFQVPPDFNLTPPSGPHISPHLLPINTGAPHHPERVHNSDFGQEWQYWSRPFPEWAKSARTVKEYMRYIRHLFETQ